MIGRRLRWVSAGLVAAATIAGTIVDDRPDRAPVMRAGLRVLEVDLHAHTRFADGFLSPFDLVIQADRRGLDALAITDHNILFPALIGRFYSRHFGGPTILVGEEITTRDYHVHGVGLEERIDASLPLDEVIDEVHRQGGVMIAAHPVKRFWPALVPARPRFDAAEVMHPIAFGSRNVEDEVHSATDSAAPPLSGPRPPSGARRDGGWRWSEMREYYEEARAQGQPLTAVASSDYHFFSPLGVTRTLVFARSESEADVLDALKKGRTVVMDLDGKAYGDPEMVAALAKEPYSMRPQDYGYRGNGWADRVFRIVGLAGLAGLVLFGRRRGANVHA